MISYLLWAMIFLVLTGGTLLGACMTLEAAFGRQVVLSVSSVIAATLVASGVAISSIVYVVRAAGLAS